MSTMFKRMLSLAVALVMIVSLIPLSATTAHAAEADTSWYSATAGTAEDPYIIDSKEDLFGLVELSKTSNFNERVIKLAANIDLTGETWQPIGYHGGNTSAKPFAGTFDGCGHTISNLTITVSSKTNQGLFGQVSGTIKNLNLTGANISGTSSYSYNHGCVAGLLADGGVLENVHVTASTIAIESYYIGGLVGTVQANVRIADCSFSGTVDGRNYIGGLVGFVKSDASLTLTNSSSAGTVMATKLKSYDSTSSLGGLIGQIKDAEATITNCSNNALISCALEKSHRGTIIGDVSGSTVTLTNVTNKNKEAKDLAGFNITSGSADSVTGTVDCGHDFVDGVCSMCGAEEPVSITTFDFLGANMALNNSLAMNFAFSGTHYEDWTGFYAEIVKEYADGREDVTVTVPYAQWERRGNNYVVTYNGVAAKEMADNFHITVYNAQGQAVSVTRTDSVRAYARRTLDNPNTTEAVKTVVVNMLNYGAAAQNYFTYGTDDLDTGDAQKT